MSNLIGEKDFQKLKDAGLKDNIENCSRKLFACCALNSEKCTFGMGKVVFMWILLSKHGIGPTE